MAERCWWCGEHSDYIAYHDDEWGMPVDDDTRLFEKLCLEGFQSGLSWLTILRKRDNFRAAFDGFEIERVARYTSRSVERLLKDAGIVRHRGKIEASINNAKRAREVINEWGTLAAFVWSFAPTSPRPKKLTRKVVETLTTSPESVALSKDLKKRGWKFVGPTTMYAFMQSMGIVNDHVDGCPARAACDAARKRFEPPTR